MTDGPTEQKAQTARYLQLTYWEPFRLKLLAVILTVGLLVEVIVWNVAAPNRTYQVFYSLPVLSALLLAVVLWWLFSGGFKQPQIGNRLTVLGGIAALFFGCFRFEGFEGDMFPRYRLRWTQTSDERLQEFLKTTANTEATPKVVVPTEVVPSADAETTSAPAVIEDAAKLNLSPDDWIEYRGPHRDGVAPRTDPVDWTKPLVEVWRHPIGAGWSSFSVADGLAFTQEQRGDRECVVCYDVQTGRQVWVHEDAARFSEALGGPGPRATPTLTSTHLYALGATGLLNCLDPRTGNAIWQRDILKDAKADNIDWAMSGSPLVVDEKVVVNPGGANGRGVIAYERTTGEEVWSAGNDRASYTAPKLATLSGTRQILILDGIGLAGHDIESGKQLWKFGWTNQPKVNASEPIDISDDSMLIASGYDLGGALVRVARTNEKWEASSVWTTRRFHMKFNAPVVHAGFAYGLDEGILECIDLADGSMKWKKGRYGYGQILRVGDAIVVLSEQGELAVVKASSERYEELVRTPAITGKTWNHPVVWRDLLLVRNGEEVACFRLPAP